MNPRPLSAGILAAGAGSRLRKEDGVPKPLRRVAGTPLIERVINDLELAGVSRIDIIINAESTVIREFVNRTTRACEIHWIVETTPSSMHSFLRVLEAASQRSAEAPVLISTVDVVAPVGTFRRFLEWTAGHDADVVLAATRRIEEERPLRIAIDDDNPSRADRAIAPVRPRHVVALGGALGHWATAGYYLAHPRVLRERAAAENAGCAALRAFLVHLHTHGYRMTALPMGDSVDVDRPPDIIAAEQLLATGQA